MNWNHNSGFNVHTKGRINGSEENGIENIARACPVLDTGYMSRALPEHAELMHFELAHAKQRTEKGSNRGQSAIAATDGITPIFLEMVKKSSDKKCIQIRQC